MINTNIFSLERMQLAMGKHIQFKKMYVKAHSESYAFIQSQLCLTVLCISHHNFIHTVHVIIIIMVM